MKSEKSFWIANNEETEEAGKTVLHHILYIALKIYKIGDRYLLIVANNVYILNDLGNLTLHVINFCDRCHPSQLASQSILLG